MLEKNKKLALEQTIDGLKSCITCLESQLKNPDDQAVVYFLDRVARECRFLKYQIQDDVSRQAAE